ncbi:hypothetical protein LMG29660_01253 [Burkholderia puraquae]|uniref:Uncharacterized protein n=1 Tax=Burkholderia puraquae TaxID=1904757 RepID=A0A6J5D8V2_9BURK|nr:hypothetical protein LMG29660_01253 [Burkholderia puraquae]
MMRKSSYGQSSIEWRQIFRLPQGAIFIAFKVCLKLGKFNRFTFPLACHDGDA